MAIRRNKMEDKQIKYAVLHVLEANEDARNNNQILCAKVYEHLGLPTDLKQLSTIKNKPSLETITRWRRKWVETYPRLKGTEKVERFRQEKIADYKQIALDVPVVGGYDDEHC